MNQRGDLNKIGLPPSCVCALYSLLTETFSFVLFLFIQLVIGLHKISCIGKDKIYLLKQTAEIFEAI